MNTNYVEIDLDEDIEYEGNTPEEKELNKQLFSTMLELNSYQDSYGKMRTVDELKERLENRKQLVHEEYIPQEDILKYEGEIKALEWVLNGSETQDEKLAKLPKASKEDVKIIISNFNQEYKQMSLEAYEAKTDESN